MAQVLGIGGVFFKTEDPAALAAWYDRVLGFGGGAWSGAMWPHGDRGCTIWSPFKADTTYFEPSTSPFMINFIVDDLDGVLARAASAGVEPTGRDDTDDNGRFAWLMDPAGLKIELWEPAPEPSEA
jgi:catechol 2,3-dioxygenase-like lactoylglutathione lyase family enzyme